MEQAPTLSTPEEELAYLREQVMRKEAEVAERGVVPDETDRAYIVSERIHAHRAASEEVLASEYQISEATKESEAEAILAELNLGEGANAIDNLRKTMEEKGIKNALAVVEKLGDPHIRDDFHRYLVRYVAAGIP
ncbi:MAG: hypothetical protein WCV89_02695, partial [Candidatus Paceibacterota bacterium]